MKTSYNLCKTLNTALGRRPRRYYPLDQILATNRSIEVWERILASELSRKDVLVSPTVND